MDTQELSEALASLTEQLRIQQEQLNRQQELITQQETLLSQRLQPPQLPNLTGGGNHNTQTSQEPGNPVISRVGIHLPPFNSADPQLWFVIADNTFRSANITTEATKYQHVVAHLGPEFSGEVKDLIINTPPTNPFTTLKDELIRRLSLSQIQKTRRLLELEQLGDLKASQFLRRLKDLGGTLVSDELIKTIWLSRLPNLVQAILASQPTLSLNDLASLADSIIETTTGHQLCGISTSSKPPTCSDFSDQPIIQKLLDQMRLMQKEIALLKARRSRSPHKRSSSPNQHNRSQTPDRSQSRSKSGLCWYHRRWGPRANKCISPCSFSTNEPSASSASSPK